MNRLKELREEAMMTVRELSERSGVSEDTITKIENGHRKGRGMTLRKLAKALGTRPHQLSPEDFARTTEVEASVLEILPQEDLLGSEKASTGPTETVVRDAPTLEAALKRAFEVVGVVEARSGLGAQDHLKSLTERQRRVLLTLVRAEGLDSSAVAEQLGVSVGTAYRDLVMLEEYDLVSCDESGERRPTALGEGVAGILARGGYHYDEALRHIAILLEAYEPVAKNEQRGSNGVESILVFELQALIVRSIRRIVAVAKPSPLAEEAHNSYLADLAGRKARRGSEALSAKKIEIALSRYMADPPPSRVIQAEIEGLPEDDVLEALGTVLAAQRTGHGTDNPYKDFLWNLKRRSPQYPTTQQGKTNDPQQAPVRRSDS